MCALCLQQEQPDFQPLSVESLDRTPPFLDGTANVFSCTFAAQQEMDVASAADWHCCHQPLTLLSSRESEPAGPREEINKDSCSLNSSSINNL